MNRHAYLPKLFLCKTVKMVAFTTGNSDSSVMSVDGNSLNTRKEGDWLRNTRIDRQTAVRTDFLAGIAVLCRFLSNGCKPRQREICPGASKCRWHPKKGRLTIQCDELWSFVDHKGNKQWVWLALDADTEIVGVTIGARDEAAARQLWNLLPGFIANARLLTPILGSLCSSSAK